MRAAVVLLAGCWIAALLWAFLPPIPVLLGDDELPEDCPRCAAREAQLARLRGPRRRGMCPACGAVVAMTFGGRVHRRYHAAEACLARQAQPMMEALDARADAGEGEGR